MVNVTRTGSLSVKQYDGGPNCKDDPNEVTTVTNPTSKAFTHTYDGKEYTIEAGETAAYPDFLAMHLSKHLAKEIVTDGVEDSVGEHGERLGNPVSKDTMFDKQAELLDKEITPEEDKESKEAVKEAAEEVAKKEGTEIDEDLICDECGFVSKSKAGLSSHMRKHE